ncbi:VWA domain-containing protein [Desulforegula conservatrix]|uniref:VWA domain-containing protein n=1 Tax=Desulforegula conservatrix TaxID=153026 RepID=UPI00042833E4|nr:VWA domain-containing protein [Desulforegula conservatrix]
MTFVNPEYFLLIWLVIPLAFIFITGIRKRNKIIFSFVSKENIAAVLPGYSAKRRIFKAFLGILIFLFLLIGAAGPQYGHIWQEYEAKGIEIILAVDCSRSMLAPDVQPTRLDRAKREIVDLISMLEGDKVGLVAFSGTAFLQCPLTLDYSGYTIFLNALSPDYLPVGGSDFEAAIKTSLESFDKNSNSEKAIIFITDGEATSGDTMKAVKEAKDKGIKIFCIGVGGETAAPVPEKGGGFKKDASGNMVLSRLDEDVLKKISAETGGSYVRSVAGDMDLDILYKKEIRGSMDQSIMRSGKRKILENRFQWPLLIAVILLFLDVFIPSSRRLSILIFFMMSSFYFGTEAQASTVNSLMKSAEKAYESKDYEKAVNDLISAQVKEPDSSDIYYNLGNTYYRMNQYDAAIKSYSGALEHSDEKNKGRIHYNLGNSKFKKGDYEAAIEDYEKSLKYNPEDKNAKENLEFTKKVMEQKKDQDNKDQENNKQDQNKKENKEQKKESSQTGNDEQNKDKNSDPNSQPNSQSDNKPENKDQNQSNKDPDSNSSQNDKEPKDQQSGQSYNQNKNGTDNADKNNAAPDKPEKPENKDAGTVQGGEQKPDENPDGKPEKKGSESNMKLNRLQDKPGAAMIPSYKKRNIEKDW